MIGTRHHHGEGDDGGLRRGLGKKDERARGSLSARVKTDDPHAVLAELDARSGTERMPFSPALDLNGISAVLYEAIGPEQFAAGQEGSQG